MSILGAFIVLFPFVSLLWAFCGWLIFVMWKDVVKGQWYDDHRYKK